MNIQNFRRTHHDLLKETFQTGKKFPRSVVECFETLVDVWEREGIEQGHT
jgi:hypothetical protein